MARHTTAAPPARARRAPRRETRGGDARRPAATPPAAGAGKPPKVRVRMYRQGLGDCFLLTFDAGGDERHALIDCGTLGAATTGVTIPEVVADIRATTHDHLSLLIATHEHHDHVSGFGTARKDFEAMRVDHVWLAWTENPRDPDAQKLAKTKDDLGKALTGVAQALQAAPPGSPAEALRWSVDASLGFFGPVAGALGFSQGVDEAMSFVREKGGAATLFHSPGDGPFELDWLPGFRFYVFGPPRSTASLQDLGEHGSSELYGLTSAINARLAVVGGAVGAATNGPAPDDPGRPFDIRFMPRESSEARGWAGGYFREEDAWRKVDIEWLKVASNLALQLDNTTNNTSLALAIERVADGKVLLFPADAQEGNWLSWHLPGMKWSVKDSAGHLRTVTAADLLARTVFYKVGHHCSHNATARAKGLELMPDNAGLTAFVPVDRHVALGRNPKGSWKMPARPLYRRLLERCEGRVARSDLGWADDVSPAAPPPDEKEFVGMATPAEWAKWKAAQQAAAHVEIKPKWIDYTLE